MSFHDRTADRGPPASFFGMIHVAFTDKFGFVQIHWHKPIYKIKKIYYNQGG